MRPFASGRGFSSNPHTSPNPLRALAAAALLLLALTLPAGAQNYLLSNVWFDAPGLTGAHLDGTNSYNRGLAYSAVSNQVFVTSRTPVDIDVFDGTAGTFIGDVNTTGVSGGTITLDQVVCADDGVIYSAWLTTAVTPGGLTLYRWSSWNVAPAIASTNDPTYGLTAGKRVGDTMTVSGSGTNTLILMGVLSGSTATTNAVLFSTVDGTNFTSTVLNISGLAASASGVFFGMAFYTNNTFLYAPNAGNLYLVHYPSPVAGQQSASATVIASSSLAANYVALSYNAKASLLATLSGFGGATATATLYSVSNFTAGLTALATTNFATPDSNGNETGAVALGGPSKTGFVYALATDNGVNALSTGVGGGPVSISLSNTWALVGAVGNLDTANDNRGMTYNAFSNQVLVNNKSTHAIQAYDGTSGAALGTVNNSGLSLGTFTLNKLGVANDGVLYGANLMVGVTGPSAPYKVYSWTNYSETPYNCYLTSASDALGTYLNGKRIGDTFAITGGGTGTLMLAGVGGTNAFVLLSTADGVNFTPTVLTVPGTQMPSPGSGVQFGLCFYTNNTFLVAPNGFNQLYLVQFPANFATLANPVTATVLATNNGLSGSFFDLSYSASAGFLAVHPNGASALTLYGLPANNFSAMALVAGTNLSFATSTTVNGNETGDIALGGVGFANDIYTLDTSAGVQATAILYSSGAVAPSITAEPAGGSAFTNVGSFTFTVGATGTQPLNYQWQFNSVSNLATATNIPTATSASYTISPLTTNASGWYDVLVSNAGGVTSSIPVQLTVYLPASSSVVTQLWALAPGSRPYLGGAGTYDTRGLAYDPITQTVLVADKNAGEFGIFVLNATNGADLFAMNTVGIGSTGNIFPLDQVGVAEDGVVYSGNLATEISSLQSQFQLVQWSSVSSSASPSQAFLGDPGNGSGDRWGDTMAVRGTGKNTQILLGSYFGFDGGPGTNAALLTTPDGVNFTSTTLTITNVAIPAGFSSLGIAFGAGNTFWAKSPGLDLYQISFDPVSGNCSVIQDIPAASSGGSTFNSMSSICVDTTNNILGGVTFNDVPNDLSLYQLSTNAVPSLFDQAFFPSFNGNIQENGVTTLKFPRVYALDVNNGIVALSYGIPPAAGSSTGNLIVNGSFESPAIASNSAQAVVPTGWSGGYTAKSLG